MAVGVVTITVEDSGGTGRNLLWWSSTGDLTGSFTPLQVLQDGAGDIISPATTGLQVSANALLTAIQAALGGSLTVTGPLTVGQLDAAGLATAAAQTAGNALLTTLAGAVAGGVVATRAGAGSFLDGWDVTQGTQADLAYGGSGAASIVSVLKGLFTGQAGGNTSLSTIATAFGAGLTVTGPGAAALATAAAQTAGNALLTAIEALLTGVQDIVRPGLTAVSTGALAAALAIKNTAGALSAVDVYSASAGWLLLINENITPSAGAVTPIKAYPVNAGSAERWQFDPPLEFAAGIQAVFSSTGPFTYTPLAAAFISGDAQ